MDLFDAIMESGSVWEIPPHECKLVNIDAMGEMMRCIICGGDPLHTVVLRVPEDASAARQQGGTGPL